MIYSFSISHLIFHSGAWELDPSYLTFCWNINLNCFNTKKVQIFSTVESYSNVLDSVTGRGNLTMRTCADRCQSSSSCTAFTTTFPPYRRDNDLNFAYLTCTLFTGTNVILKEHDYSGKKFAFSVSGLKRVIMRGRGKQRNTIS